MTLKKYAAFGLFALLVGMVGCGPDKFFWPAPPAPDIPFNTYCNIVAEVNNSGDTIRYTYETSFSVNRLTRVDYPDGSRIIIQYGEFGPTSISDLSRDSLSGRIYLFGGYLNGNPTSVTELRRTGGSEAIRATYRYSYLNNGNLQRIVRLAADGTVTDSIVNVEFFQGRPSVIRRTRFNTDGSFRGLSTTKVLYDTISNNALSDSTTFQNSAEYYLSGTATFDPLPALAELDILNIGTKVMRDPRPGVDIDSNFVLTRFRYSEFDCQNNPRDVPSLVYTEDNQILLTANGNKVARFQSTVFDNCIGNLNRTFRGVVGCVDAQQPQD